MPVRRLLRLSLALLASVALAAPVNAATSGSTSVLNVWGSMGVWGTHTHFFATWQATRSSVWLVDDLDMDATVVNGDDCTTIVCTQWSYGASATFLSATGAKVGTVLVPPTGSCHTSVAVPRDRPFSRCYTNAFGVSLSATKVKFTWTVSVKRRDGLWVPAWSATKTVPIQ